MYYFDQLYDQDQIEKILIEKPLSLLIGKKLDFIISTIKDKNLKNLLEIGTFAGGTSYILSTEVPNCKITSIDINDFYTYFNNDRWILESLKQRYFNIDININNFYKIQDIYKKLSPSCVFLCGSVRSIDVSNFDAVIIDGNHTSEGLMDDLEYCYNNIKKGVIFVDDCVYAHIRKCCEQFCLEKNLECEFVVYCDYGTKSGEDLCVIEKR